MNAGQIIVIGLSLALVLWFAAGTWYNRRRARQVWRWLEPGLTVFDGQVGNVWIGASGAGLRVDVNHASPPVRRFELTVSLLSRENLPLWLYELTQGKRDQLSFRVWLSSRGSSEIELAPVDSALDQALQDGTDQRWQRANASSQWVVAWRGSINEEKLGALRAFTEAYARQLQRYSKRHSEPHLLVQMSLDELTAEASQRLFQQLKATLNGRSP